MVSWWKPSKVPSASANHFSHPPERIQFVQYPRLWKNIAKLHHVQEKYKYWSSSLFSWIQFATSFSWERCASRELRDFTIHCSHHERYTILLNGIDWFTLYTYVDYIEEYSEGGILSRTCEGDVGVAKCEGSCSSQVQPSVVHPSGFLKVIRDKSINHSWWMSSSVGSFILLYLYPYRNVCAAVSLSFGNVSLRWPIVMTAMEAVLMDGKVPWMWNFGSRQTANASVAVNLLIRRLLSGGWMMLVDVILLSLSSILLSCYFSCVCIC